MIKIIPKHIELTLVDHLSHKEFRCQCTRTECHYTIVNEHLLHCFWKLREEWGKPIPINSGFRCQAHNKETKGSVPKSKHTIGSAIDLRKPSDENEAMLFQALCDFHFPHIIPYDSFVHCDVRDN